MQTLAIPGTTVPHPDALALPAGVDQHSLTEAFGAFSTAARSLQHSYFSLGEEVRRLRRELEQERELRRRREALAEMSALLAHEVRNPVASLELFAGLLAESELGVQEQECVEQIQSGLRMLSATVNNVLEFHSPSSFTRSPTELHSVLRSIQSLLAPVADGAGVKVTLNCAADPLWIQADRHRLEHIFLNLALNAFRFAADGRKLLIKTRREQATALITFADKGPGIREDIRSNVFDAGFTTRAGGPGLGLAVAKKMVEQHGGSIGVTSSPGGGTTFVLRFPLGAQ